MTEVHVLNSLSWDDYFALHREEILAVANMLSNILVGGREQGASDDDKLVSVCFDLQILDSLYIESLAGIAESIEKRLDSDAVVFWGDGGRLRPVVTKGGIQLIGKFWCEGF